MKLRTIALASALAMSSTFAFAQAGGGTAGTSSGRAVNGGSTTAAPSTTNGGERMQKTTPGVKPPAPPQSPAAWISRNRAANQPRASPRATSNPLGILISRVAFPQRCRGLHNLAFEPLA